MEPKLTVSVKELERLVYHGHIEQASSLIVKLLTIVEIKGSLQFDDKAKSDFLNKYTRLASAFTAFFANPNLALSPNGFQIIAGYKEHLLGIFELSGFEGTDHLLRLIGSQDETKSSASLVQNEQQWMKFLLLYSLYSEIEKDFSSLLKKFPGLVFPAYLGLIREKCVLTTSAAKKRDDLLQMGSLLENMTIYPTFRT